MGLLKLFDNWNIIKKKTSQDAPPKLFINQREIWFTKMGKNIGYEEDGKDRFLRPVLVIKKVGCLFFTVALTSQGNKNSNYYHKINRIALNNKNQKHKNNSYAILSQAKVMDKKRFTEKMGVVEKKEFNDIKEKLKTLLF